MRLLVTHFGLILFLSPVIQNTYGDNVKSMQSALFFFNLHAQSTICYIFGDPNFERSISKSKFCMFQILHDLKFAWFKIMHNPTLIHFIQINPLWNPDYAQSKSDINLSLEFQERFPFSVWLVFLIWNVQLQVLTKVVLILKVC